MAIRCRRAAAIRPGSANTSVATRAASRADRTAGNPSANLVRPAWSASKRSSGRMAPSSSPAQRRSRLGRRVGGDERLGVGLEKADVGAGRGDGDLDGEDLLPRQPAHDVAHQRRLAVAARRDQEHLLAGGQVAAQPGALVLAVGERRRGDDLAVDERVVWRHYVIIRNDYVKQRNPSTRAAAPTRRCGSLRVYDA